MKYLLMLTLTLISSNSFSKDKTDSVKTREPSSNPDQFICANLNYEFRYQDMAKILNDKCDSDKYVQIFQNKEGNFIGYCCASK